MKTITVDFSSSKPVQPFYGGEVGENRAVYLDIIPSTDMSEDENIAIYYVAFTVEGGIILSETFNQGEDISISLGSVITEQRKVFFQLIATSSDGESVISKSPIVQLFLGKSITGEIIPDPVSGDTIYTEIARLVEAAEHIDLSEYYTKTEVDDIVDNIKVTYEINGTAKTGQEWFNLYQTAVLKYRGNDIIGGKYDESAGIATFYFYENGIMGEGFFSITIDGNKSIAVDLAVKGTIHKHENKSVIDKFSEDDGKLLYDGSPIGGDSKLVELCKTEIGVDYSIYTPSEILQMKADGIGMTYKGRIVTTISAFENDVFVYYWSQNELYSVRIAPNKTTQLNGEGGTMLGNERIKLTGIETGAQVNIIEKIKKADGTELPITNKTVTLPEAEAALTEEQIISVCSILADFITDGTNIIGVDSTTALAF